MGHFYAQLDEAGVCFAVSELSGEVESPDMIRLDSYSIDYLGRVYSGGAWTEPKARREPMPDITLADVAQQVSALEARLIVGGVV